MFRYLMETVDKMQENMGNTSREMEILLKNPNEMQEIKISDKNEDCL